tara:strand:- start:299 stop:1276 length:978 start_codon:yes stop_codon:yes gene_type:complete
MKKTLKFTCLISILSLLSCNVLKVSSNHDKDNDGIPFYVQKPIIKQQTKYLYDWHEISLIKEELKDDKTIATILHTLRITKNNNDLNSVNDVLTLLNEDKVKLPELITKMDALIKIPLESANINATNLIENSWKEIMVVDYANKYYLNAKMPWFGNSSLSQKISTDGTLTESTSSSDSQLDELATALIGIATPISQFRVAELPYKYASLEGDNTQEAIDKSVIEKGIKPFVKWGMSDNVMDVIKKELKLKPTYKISISEKGYIYTFTKDLEIDNKNIANTPIPFSVNSGSYTRSNWPPEIVVKKEEKQKKETIDVTAQIGLPKKE